MFSQIDNHLRKQLKFHIVLYILDTIYCIPVVPNLNGFPLSDFFKLFHKLPEKNSN